MRRAPGEAAQPTAAAAEAPTPLAQRAPREPRHHRTLAAEHPRHNDGWTIRLEPLQQAINGDLRPTLLLLFGSAGVLLLVAAVNLANMLLARAAARQREIVVRRAVGAGDFRLIRQLLTENVVLALVGGAAGVAGAVWGVQAWRAAWQDPVRALSYE